MPALLRACLIAWVASSGWACGRARAPSSDAAASAEAAFEGTRSAHPNAPRARGRRAGHKDVSYREVDDPDLTQTQTKRAQQAQTRAREQAERIMQQSRDRMQQRLGEIK